MAKYDSKQSGDKMGSAHSAAGSERVKSKGNSHGIKSSGKEYFPKSAKEHSLPKISQSEAFEYPDQAEDIIAEQNGNEKMIRGGKPKKMYRK